MAGLLHSIARQLFGSKAAEQPMANHNRTAYNHKTTASKTSTESGFAFKPDTKENTGSHVIDRTMKRERTQTEVAREDYLLNQIDEFRERAQKLQDLLLSKESKAEELQTIVDERESKAKELQDILEERQRKADGITAEMNKQIDNLIDKVTAKLSEIEASISEDIKNGQSVTEEQAAQLKEALETVNSQLEVLKGDLSDKIHSENVKSYRNVADLFKGLEEKVNKVEVIEAKTKAVHKCVIALIILSAINLVGLGVFAFLQLGAFGMLLGQ